MLSGELIAVLCEAGYKMSYRNEVRCVAGSITDPPTLPSCKGTFAEFEFGLFTAE